MLRLLRCLPLMLVVLLSAGSGCSKSDDNKPSVDPKSSGRDIKLMSGKKRLPPIPQIKVRPEN